MFQGGLFREKTISIGEGIKSQWGERKERQPFSKKGIRLKGGAETSAMLDGGKGGRYSKDVRRKM